MPPRIHAIDNLPQVCKIVRLSAPEVAQLFNKMAETMSVGACSGWPASYDTVPARAGANKILRPILKGARNDIELKSLIMAQIERWRYA